jgi:hypothetical protein
MKPDVPKLLEILSARLMFDVAPNVQPSYRQSSVGITGILLTMVREETERAAARRVDENAALRALFGRAAGQVTDTACVASSKGREPRLISCCPSSSAPTPNKRPLDRAARARRRTDRGMGAGARRRDLARAGYFDRAPTALARAVLIELRSAAPRCAPLRGLRPRSGRPSLGLAVSG